MKSAAWVLVIALAAVAGWLWYDRGATDLTVNGEATVKAAPDEYVFMPSYQEKGTDETTVRDTVTKTGNGVVTKLREQGVTDGMMSSSVTVSQDYGYPIYDTMPTDEAIRSSASGRYVGTYSLTVTLDSVELARKVKDTLAQTPLVGAVTPISGFTDATRNQLEREARKLAIEDAKTQAEDTASTLEVKLRGIKSIGQPTWDGPIPLAYDLNVAAGREVAAPTAVDSPDLLTGEQEVSYSIQVVYRVR